MKIAGVDEAGKGPVIGPMCVAGVLITEDKLHLIEELPGIGAERLDIFPPALSINSVEGK